MIDHSVLIRVKKMAKSRSINNPFRNFVDHGAGVPAASVRQQLLRYIVERHRILRASLVREWISDRFTRGGAAITPAPNSNSTSSTSTSERGLTVTPSAFGNISRRLHLECRVDLWPHLW
jgi:hypothetical protein